MKRIALALTFLAMSALLLAGMQFPTLGAHESEDPKPAEAPTPNSWTTMAPIQGKFSGTLGTAVVNGKIYFLGSGINQQYDPVTNTWTNRTPSPTFVYGYESWAAVAACQNKIYVIGVGVNEVYDPETDTWENRTSMPIQRYALEANVVDGKIYVISGQIPAGLGVIDASNANEVYDPANDSWTEMAPIPTPVVLYASAVLDDKIYIIGGINHTSYWDRKYNSTMIQVQIYDPKTDQWTQGTPILIGVSAAAASATTGLLAPKRIYVIGGNTIDQSGSYTYFSDTTQIYDLETGNWSIGAQMPTGRSSLSIANINDVLYAMGGTNKSLYDVTLPGNFSQAEWEAAMNKIASARVHANEKYIPIGYSPSFSPSPSPSPTAMPIFDWSNAYPILEAAVIIVAVATAALVLLREQRHRPIEKPKAQFLFSWSSCFRASVAVIV